MSRAWFITGSNRGLGRAFTDAILANGDRVVATARRPEALRDELRSHGDRAVVLGLDVADRAVVHDVVARAIDAFGGLDVVVNNAGYGLAGAVEEVAEAEARAQFDTNFFGALWVTQAVLPHFRQQRAGHIIQISSIAGIASPMNLGIYAASKWALEAMSEALANEVGPLGVKVTIIEPSGFRTDWAGDSMHRATPMAAYNDVLAVRRAAFDPATAPVMAGDPELAARALLEVVSSADPPLRVPLGEMALNIARATYDGRLSSLSGCEELARSVDAPT